MTKNIFIVNEFSNEPNINIIVGDYISFHTCSNPDRKILKGIVKYKDQLGFITIINNVQYELRKLLDITKIATTYTIPKVPLSFYFDYNIINNRCTVYQETKDDRVHTKFVSKTNKTSCNALTEDDKNIYITI